LLLVVLLITGKSPAAEDGALSSDAVRAATMARQIDALLQERWEAAGLQPAPLASDAEFLRRVYLDLTGRLPSVWQTRQFLHDTDPDKRARLIDTLVHSPRFAAHAAAVWRRILVPQSIEPAQAANAAGLQRWLEEQFVERQRFDNLVAALLTAQGDGSSGPALYYETLQARPEKLAASTAAIFLGLQIQCAECHDHPFDHWKQRDFWGYAAFFAQLERPSQDGLGPFMILDRDSGEVTLPGTDEVVPPRFPSGELAAPDGYGTRRARLAIWMASRDNPYLPRAAANWAWFLMFGRGLVHPVDDHGPHNPPVYPEVLDAVTQFFIETGFDWSLLVQTLAMTRAYQLASGTSAEPPPPESFARHLPKTLDAETLYDIMQEVTSLGRSASRPEPLDAIAAFDPARTEFVMRMQAANSREPTHYEGGLPQALFLMNGPFTERFVSPQFSNLLQAVSAPFLNPEQQLEIVYLATLCRYPDEQERGAFQELCQQEPDTRAVLSDVLWAILNSAEFRLNN